MLKRTPTYTSFKRDELLQKLRTDPRFKAFLRKMNLPE